MRVLWITNSLAFPDICLALGIPEPQLGGWMKSLLSSLRSQFPEISFGIATLYERTNVLIEKEIDGVTYFCIPGCTSGKYNAQLETVWKQIEEQFRPDVVHIHGTEFSHGLAYMVACGSGNVCISLQGVISGIGRYNLGGIPMEELKKYRTLYDYLKTSVTNMQSEMSNRIKLEKEYFIRAKHVIGRTDWDKTHLWAINPQVEYYFCNENLREAFYKGETWQYGKCQPFRIFLSQAASPLKGIQKVIEALPIVVREYPKTEVYVAGSDYTLRNTIKEKLRFRAYPNYICHLMDKTGVKERIHFTGFLDAEGMKQQYLKAHVFVCPSSVENSPNSLGEAQILGTPCIAAASGGIPSMVKHGETGLLYRYEEHEYLAKYICELFRSRLLAENLSKNEKASARERHNREQNALHTYEIYHEILSRK